MGRKFEHAQGRYAWNLEACEEEILIAGYDEIRRFIPPGQTWTIDFENRFFGWGTGVAVEFLDSINAVRRRRSLDEIVIRETDVYDYGRCLDKPFRSNQRRRVREELNTAKEDVRQRRLELAKAEAERLPPPHRTYEEYKAWRQQHQVESHLSLEEVTRRRLAQQAAVEAKSPTKPTTLDPERAERMFKIATPGLWGDIISNLSVEDALVVAEKIENPELRDALVKHSLGVS
jgi:hypothetical protein